MNLKDSMAHYVKKGEEREQKLIKHDFIPISEIDLNPDNVFAIKDTEEEIAEFAKSLKDADGAMHNIVVERKGDRYMLISGERRLRAYKLLNKETIFAQIRPEGSWLDNFKLLCSANTETRKYTNERCDLIIGAIKEKLAENCPDENNRSLLLSMVQNAFGISQVQAYKYVNVSEDLNDSLKNLYYEEVFGIDEAVLYSSLTQEAQDKVFEIYGEHFDNAKDISQNYAKKVKVILDNYKKESKKLKFKLGYASNRLELAKEAGKEEDVKKYEESLAAIEKMMQELLDKQTEDIKNVEITEPTEQPKKSPAEVNRDNVNKIGKILDSYVKQNGSNETVEKIRELLATLLS